MSFKVCVQMLMPAHSTDTPEMTPAPTVTSYRSLDLSFAPRQILKDSLQSFTNATSTFRGSSPCCTTVNPEYQDEFGYTKVDRHVIPQSRDTRSVIFTLWMLLFGLANSNSLSLRIKAASQLGPGSTANWPGGTWTQVCPPSLDTA